MTRARMLAHDFDPSVIDLQNQGHSRTYTRNPSVHLQFRRPLLLAAMLDPR